ncbi:MAG: hypothetical protein ACR2IF_01115 [Terriglobales bacterium]
MKDHAPTPHPGPYRIMRINSESAGIIIAIGFVVMGVVGIPIAKWFLIAGIVLGIGVALLLRYWRKRPPTEDPDPLRNLR